jgi:hypothetical protein
MTMIRDMTCKLGLHRWESPEGDDYGAHRRCSYCGKVKRLYPDLPPDAHDRSGVHH